MDTLLGRNFSPKVNAGSSDREPGVKLLRGESRQGCVARWGSLGLIVERKESSAGVLLSSVDLLVTPAPANLGP